MEIHAMPGHLIRRLNQISVALFVDRMDRAGLRLTPVQFAAMCAIRNHPGIDQATVAGLIAYDRATLGKVIDKLDERGLVLRSRSRGDRRAKVLWLTEQGEEMYSAAMPYVEKVQSDMLSSLSADEQQVFMHLMSKLTIAGNDLSRAPLKHPTPKVRI